MNKRNGLFLLAGIALSVSILFSSSVQAGLILNYDSLTGNIDSLSQITSVTDSAFVSSASATSTDGGNPPIAGGFANGTQTNVTGPNATGFDLAFRFAANPETAIASGAAGINTALANGYYLEYQYTAAMAQILTEVSANIQANSQNASTHAARDSAVFVDVAGGGFNQFGAIDDRNTNGNFGAVSYTGAVNVATGDTVTIRHVFADRTNLSQNLQAATRIGNFEVFAEAIPEPTTIGFLFLSIGMVVFARRKRR